MCGCVCIHEQKHSQTYTFNINNKKPVAKYYLGQHCNTEEHLLLFPVHEFNNCMILNYYSIGHYFLAFKHSPYYSRAMVRFDALSIESNNIKQVIV